MPVTKSKCTRYFPERVKHEAEPPQIRPEDSESIDEHLCRDCVRLLRGQCQTWTEQDLILFENASSNESTLSQPNTPDEVEQMLNRCHYYSLDDMLTRARSSSCQLCVMIHAAFGDETGTTPEEFFRLERDCLEGRKTDFSVRIALQTIFNIGRFPYSFAVDIGSRNDQLHLWTTLHLIPSTEADLTSTGLPMGDSTSSDKSFALAKSWLSTCLRDHPDCNAHIMPGRKLPARLLDVDNVQLTGKVFLCDTSSLSEQYEYLTLSHCWGKSDRLVLTKDNLPELISGITVTRLALTFQHAVEITQQLGYRYLWIDSLCIVQNSVDDWNVEASKMASIYSGSVLCIAALASSDSSEGCYRNRDPSLLRPMKIEHKLFPRLPIFEYSGPTLLATKDILGAITASNFTEEPLELRKWTLQESILAPRTLGYSMQEITWECRKTSASEIWPTGIPVNIWNRALDGFGKSIFDTSKLLPVESKTGCHVDNKRTLYHRWETLVTKYSNRSLTRNEDIFPALAGIADMIAMLTQDHYCAGLWRNEFRRGLTWSGLTSNNSSSQYLAPSWSWASANSEVVYDGVNIYTSDMECDVEEVYVEHVIGATSGKLKSARATLRGMMRCVQWSISDLTPRLVDGDWTGWLNTMVTVNSDTRHAKDLSPIYLFQLYRSTSTARYNSDTIRCMYLLVLEATGLAKNEFRRVGCATSYGGTFQVYTPEDWRYFEQGWTSERITIL